MVASPETITTARSLAGDYERWTATENHDCPTVEIYVYDAPPDEVRQRIQMGTSWLDGSDVLREIGPQPDIWLATSSHELPDPPSTAIAGSTPFAYTPVVLAVPSAEAGRHVSRQGTWADTFQQLADQGVDVVRADPNSTELGLLATALLYGPSGQVSPPSPHQLAPAEIEQRIAVSLDNGGFPLTDTPGLLCRHRLLGSSAAVIASEQQVVRVQPGRSARPVVSVAHGQPRAARRALPVGHAQPRPAVRPALVE